jgi:hypothetical protein
MKGACAHPDQVRFELVDHREHVEEMPSDGVGRIADRPAEVELDFARCEFVDDVACVGQRPRQMIELGRDQRVARAARGERFAQSRTGAGRARRSVGGYGASRARPAVPLGVPLPGSQCAPRDGRSPPVRLPRSRARDQMTNTTTTIMTAMTRAAMAIVRVLMVSPSR